MAGENPEVLLRANLTQTLSEMSKLVTAIQEGKKGTADLQKALDDLGKGLRTLDTGAFKDLQRLTKQISVTGIGELHQRIQTTVVNALAQGVKSQIKAATDAFTQSLTELTGKKQAEFLKAISTAEAAISRGRLDNTFVRADRERQIQQFQRSNNINWWNDTNSDSLKLREEASRRKAAAFSVVGNEEAARREEDIVRRIRGHREEIERMAKQAAQASKDAASKELADAQAIARIRDSIARAQLKASETTNPVSRAKIEMGIAEQRMNLGRVQNVSPEEAQRLAASYRDAQRAVDVLTGAQNEGKKAVSDHNRYLAEQAKLQARVKVASDDIKKARAEERVALSQLDQAIKTNNKNLEDQAVRALNAARANLQAAENAKKATAEASKAPKVQAAPKTDAEIAQRSIQIQEARFGLNGGADLFRLQAQIMSNWQMMTGVLNAFKFSVGFVTEFEASLAQLQAISGATDTSMRQLKNSIVAIAQTTKYSAKEIADASVLMAQAGLSAAEIDKSLKSVAQFATATGTSMKDAVDVITSALSVFSLRAEEAARVSDMFTAALNDTKLDPTKLALGLQYVSNVAAQSNITLGELTAVLGGLSNAGIRSGSTIATGLRQLIIDLSTPSSKLIEELGKVGLTEEAVDIKTKGLVNVLMTLREAGFSTANAMKSLEVRAASAYSALLKQLDNIPSLTESLNEAGKAAKANATQMDTLQAALLRFQNVWGESMTKFFGPALDGFKNITNAASDFLIKINEYPKVIEFVGTAFSTYFGLKAATMVGNLVVGLAKLALGVGAVGEAIKGASTLMGTFSAAAGAIGKTNLVLIGLSAIVATLAATWDMFGEKTKSTKDKLEELEGAIETTTGRINNEKTTIEAVNAEIGRLIERSGNMKSQDFPGTIAELRARFQDLGISIADNVTKVDQLIEALRRVRGAAAERMILDMQINMAEIEQKVKLLEQNLREKSYGVFAGKDNLNTLLNRYRFRPDSDTTELNRIATGVSGEISSNRENFDPSRLISFMASLKELEQKLQTDREIPNRDKQLKAVDELRGVITDFVKDANELRKTREALGRTGQNIEQTKVVNNGRYQELETTFKSASSEKQGIYKQLEDGSLSADDRKRLMEKLGDKVLTGLHSVVDTLDNDPQFKVGGPAVIELRDRAKSLITEITGKSSTIAKEATEASKKAFQEGIAEASERLKLVRAKLTGKDFFINEENLRQLEGQGAGAINEEYEQKRKLARAQMEKRGKNDSDALGQRLELIEAERREALEKWGIEVNNVRELTKKTVLGFDDFVSRLKGALKDINSSLKNALDRAKAPVKELDLTIEAAGNVKNRDRISGVEVQALKDRKIDVEVSSYQNQVAAINDALKQLENKKGEVDTALRDREMKYMSLSANNTGTRDDLRVREESMKKLDQEINGVKTEREGIERRINELLQDREELMDREKALNGEIKESSFIDSIGMAWEQYKRTEGMNKTIMAQMKDGLPSAFRTAQGAMSEFFYNAVTGTKSVSSAFKNMAKSIVEAMAQIATNQLAGMLLGLAVKGMMMAFGGSDTSSPYGEVGGGSMNTGLSTGSYGYSADVPTTFAVGGMVPLKYYASGTPGGVPGRDSVLAKLMPGEYVLRKSAVDLVGRDYLDDLNTAGNHRVQRSAAALSSLADAQRGSERDQGIKEVNVWVVTKDQAPPPGPEDIIAAVSDDILKRGRIKQLIAKVNRGEIG